MYNYNYKVQRIKNKLNSIRQRNKSRLSSATNLSPQAIKNMFRQNQIELRNFLRSL